MRERGGRDRQRHLAHGPHRAARARPSTARPRARSRASRARAAIELAPYGIRVNSVAPGLTETPMVATWLAEQDDPAALPRARHSPTSRSSASPTPADVATAICYLASDAAALDHGRDASRSTAGTRRGDGRARQPGRRLRGRRAPVGAARRRGGGARADSARRIARPAATGRWRRSVSTSSRRRTRC